MVHALLDRVASEDAVVKHRHSENHCTAAVTQSSPLLVLLWPVKHTCIKHTAGGTLQGMDLKEESNKTREKSKIKIKIKPKGVTETY